MPIESTVQADGLLRIVIRPDAREYVIEPDAEALSTTPGGLPMPAVIHRGRLVAGGATYRLCQARNLACPAVELAAELEPDAALAGLAAWVDALAPGPRTLLAATRVQSGRGRPPRGAATISRVRAAELAGATPATIAEAQATLADPERLERAWCRDAHDEAPAAPTPRAGHTPGTGSPAGPQGPGGRPRATEGVSRTLAGRRSSPARRPALGRDPGSMPAAGTPGDGATGSGDAATLVDIGESMKRLCEVVIRSVETALEGVEQAVALTGSAVKALQKQCSENRELKQQLDQVRLHLGTSGAASGSKGPRPGDLH